MEGILLIDGLHICQMEWHCTYVEADDVNQQKGMQGCVSLKATLTDLDGLVRFVICMAEKSPLLKQHRYSQLRLSFHRG